MTVRELIAKLQKSNPNAEVRFFDHSRDCYLNLQTVDNGAVKGVDVVIIGECDIKTKLAVMQAEKAKPRIFGDIFFGNSGR